MVARKVLDSSRPQHERLLATIRSNPGIHIRRLAQLVGMSWNTCLHHLRSMEAEKSVVSRKVQGKVCYFDATQGAVKGKEAMALLRDPENRRIAQQILAMPGAKQIELARELDLPTSNIHRRVSRMEDAGLITRTPQSRSMLIFPSDSLVPIAQDAGLIAGAEDDVFGFEADADAPIVFA